MAKATVTTKKPEVEKVHLTLSAEEADALVVLFDYVGGSPADSGRKHIDAIDKALRTLGIAPVTSRYKNQIGRHHLGGIYFKPEESWTLSAF